MMKKKTKRTKKRENIDLCDDLNQTLRWSMAVGRVSWWSRWVNMGQDVHDCGSRAIASSFSDLGFDVNVGLLFFTPGEAFRNCRPDQPLLPE